ncbi:collagen binding domain-containing protein [Streptococcus equi]|uniref:collagen binding domain-containing protein n=1 Tax=Streptococcus equi TaxID=1336 RepID=UPI001E3397EA|nr:collagen binding domain-containing protein [Streptococcus equi]
MKQLTKIVSVVLLLVFTLSASLHKVRATNLSDNITSLTVASSSLRDGERTTVKVEFDAKSAKIKEGDIIEVTWPTSGNIYIQGFTKTIPLMINSINVGTLDVTLDKAVFRFNKNIETMQNVTGWGEFEITVRNVTQTTTETLNNRTTTVRVGNHTATINVTKPEAGTGTSSFYYKTGDMQPDDTDHVRWFLLINNNKEWVADTVTVEDDIQGGQTLDMTSFDITVSGYRNERFVGEKALEEFRQKFPNSVITATANHISVSLAKDDASKNTVNIAYKTKITDYDQKEFANNSKIWYQILYKDQVSGQESNHQVANVNANGGVDGSRYTSFTVKKI